MKNLKYHNKWIDYQYNLHYKIITKENINEALNKFWNEKITNNVKESQIILIQFKVKLSNDIIRSISHLQNVTNSDFELLLDLFLNFWEIKSEDYHTLKFEEIIFTYKIIESNEDINKTKLSKPMIKIKENKPVFNFGGFNLPSTMDITKWGDYVFKNDYKNAIVYKPQSKAIYHINLFDNYQKVELKLKDKVIIEFKDTMRDKNNLNSFIRDIKKQKYIFEDGELILKNIIRKTPFLSQLNQSPIINKNIITMDLETRLIDGIMIPYCVSIFDGKVVKSFYLSDYKNSDKMLTVAITYLMKRKYHKYKVFLHNFSHFDGIFLLRILSSLSDNIKPIIRDGRIIDLKFTFSSNNYVLNFRDSFLLLPSSLDKLTKNFNVSNKTIFPYLFVNDKNIELNYIGKVPSFDKFSNISIEQYNSYCNSIIDESWDLKKESIKYCEQDVKSLYQVLDKFSDRIFMLFRIDILKYPTLSSLAFAIYRSNFLRKDVKIPLIKGELFNFFKRGYTGGSVDVYKPYGKNIYRYDVNSLYPYVMKNEVMPVGNPTYFEGDITKLENKPFGIFEVEVEAPKKLDAPILQLRFRTNTGIKTLSPLGRWKGVYLSAEIYNAIKFGYTFKILRGYTFDQDYIFTEFVDNLYQLKLNSNKNSPDYTIAKLILNSLYGRLGMNPEMEKHKIVTKNKQIFKFYNKYNITNIIDLNNGKELISFFDDINNNNDKSLNISIPISLAVTAYSRIFMSQFKNNPEYILYYSDTDSLDINKTLATEFVGNELGKLKLEHIFDEAVFLSPKVYGGKTSNYEYVKIKGLKNPISFNELSTLLIKDNKIIIEQDKWFKDISKGNITIKNEIYTLMLTENKRKLIFDTNNKFIDTKPLILNNDQIINNN
jgi:hypothetical protein